MLANPGGNIGSDNVIGRDALIKQIWRALNAQSVLLTSIRRIGKTSIIKKMAEEAPVDVIPIYRDLEKIRTPIEFAEQLFRDIETHLSGQKRLAVRSRKLISEFAGLKVGEFQLPAVMAQHWKELIQQSIEDLCEHQDRVVVFFWDELPWMIEKIRLEYGAEEARDLLDLLRALRQSHTTIRMVYTGSVGLHHVVTSLQRSGYVNAPTNDMKAIEVLSLSLPDAVRLAEILLEGESISTDDPQAVAKSIADAAGNIPYYIHHIVDQMAFRNEPVSSDAAQRIVTSMLTSPNDPWDMQHFRERLGTYYRPDDCAAAVAILDALASSDLPISLRELQGVLGSAQLETGKEPVINVLTLLQRDHYILLNEDGCYSFSYAIIKQWWRIRRGLL